MDFSLDLLPEEEVRCVPFLRPKHIKHVWENFYRRYIFLHIRRRCSSVRNFPTKNVG